MSFLFQPCNPCCPPKAGSSFDVSYNISCTPGSYEGTYPALGRADYVIQIFEGGNLIETFTDTSPIGAGYFGSVSVIFTPGQTFTIVVTITTTCGTQTQTRTVTPTAGLPRFDAVFDFSFSTIPNCDCSCCNVPTVLNMVSASETCNFGMFHSCTIKWQAVPEVYSPLGLGVYAFISDESFSDPLQGGAEFQYLLVCFLNQFSLTRIYSASIYGGDPFVPGSTGPWQDAILYTWFVGTPNTCHPFSLTLGSAYPGSDGTCFVTITG